MPALGVISDFVVVCLHPSQVFAERESNKAGGPLCVCTHTCSLKYASLQILPNSGRHGYRMRIEYYMATVVF